MGYASQRQQPLGIGIISRLLELIKEEAVKQEQTVAREYINVGAAVAKVEKVEFSRIPMGDDSQADEKVALGLLIESNCM